METLVMISRAHADTAFRLAKEMYNDGDKVNIIFMGRGKHHCGREEVVESLNWANLYTFETEFDSTTEEVKAVSYDFFIELLEKANRTFSWI